jgi:hypothetical protein
LKQLTILLNDITLREEVNTAAHQHRWCDVWLLQHCVITQGCFILSTSAFAAARRGSTSTEGPLGPSPGLGWDANAPKYAIIKNMLGYSSRGNVFVKPTPDVPTAVGPVALAAPTMSLVGAAAAPAIGIVGKARAMMAGLFAAATRVIWKPITWLFKKTQPTYLGYIAEG